MKELVDREIVEIAPIAYLRGRSIHDAFIIADEAQNMNHHEVKTLLTRSGQGTKVVFTGDPDQVDVPDSGADHQRPDPAGRALQGPGGVRAT